MTQKTKIPSTKRTVEPTTSNKSYLDSMTSWLKAWIITLALWGWLPYRLAEWILRRGGHDED